MAMHYDARALRLFADPNEVKFGPEAYREQSKEWSVEPKARASDPSTSHEAASRTAAGDIDCIEAIRVVAFVNRIWNFTAFEIAAQVEVDYPGRWDEGSVRTRIKRAGLTVVDREGVSPRGSKCSRYTLAELRPDELQRLRVRAGVA